MIPKSKLIKVGIPIKRIIAITSPLFSSKTLNITI